MKEIKPILTVGVNATQEELTSVNEELIKYLEGYNIITYFSEKITFNCYNGELSDDITEEIILDYIKKINK